MDLEGNFSRSSADGPKILARPSVSIAMGTYNGEKYIREQLDSLAAQTKLPRELVVTDDGSTDSTIDIVIDFQKTAPFEVRIFRNDRRLGFADNFLKAASLCLGTLIAFCDQDDIWLPNKFETCIPEFKDEEVLLCVHSSVVWQTNVASNRRWPDFKRRKVFSPCSTDPLGILPGFSMIVRKKILDIMDGDRRPIDYFPSIENHASMCHDQWVWYLASIFGKIVFVPESLALYRQHAQNVFGAIEDRSALQNLKRSVNSKVFSDRAFVCSRHSEFLADFLKDCPDNFKVFAHLAASNFRNKGRLQSLRSLIYNDQANFFSRLRYFLSILGSGGYLSSPASARLGPKSGIKDLCFGVPGLYRLLR